jgi:hypothetical protein
VWENIKNSINKRIAFWTKVFGLVSLICASGASIYTIYSNGQQTKITRETARQAINAISTELSETREKLAKLEGKVEAMTNVKSWFSGPTNESIAPMPKPTKRKTWDDYEQTVQQKK